jgi:hypothetical protein
MQAPWAGAIAECEVHSWYRSFGPHPRRGAPRRRAAHRRPRARVGMLRCDGTGWIVQGSGATPTPLSATPATPDGQTRTALDCEKQKHKRGTLLASLQRRSAAREGSFSEVDMGMAEPTSGARCFPPVVAGGADLRCAEADLEQPHPRSTAAVVFAGPRPVRSRLTRHRPVPVPIDRPTFAMIAWRCQSQPLSLPRRPGHST